MNIARELSRRPLTSFLVQYVFCALALASSARAQDVVWQIGKADHDHADLTRLDDLNGYLQAFPQDVTFTVGQSDPRKDFSAVHPGPMDMWAGHREHPFRILFDLAAAPTGRYLLEVDLVDTHATYPPRLNIAVNEDRVEIPLTAGVGDLALMRPEKGNARAMRFVLSADRLRAGRNTIELRGLDGAWFLYDAISLRRLGAEEVPPVELVARATMFLIEEEGKLLQEVSFTADGLVGDEAAITVSMGGANLEPMSLERPAFGMIRGNIHLAEAESPRQVSITLRAGRQSATTSVTQEPVRKWRIFVAPATHTDIGYTDIQENVIGVHNRNTDLALELLAEFPLYHWNLESSWAAQMWLRDRVSSRHDELYQAARQDRLGVESSYLNMLTGLCSGEELIRNLYYSARLARERGVPFKSHTLTDAPSHVWTLPSILAGAGIKYLSVGSNLTRAPLFRKGVDKKSPFWWEGPDGARVLTWFTTGYSQAGHLALMEGPDRMRIAVERHLYGWNRRTDYPYDAILLHGAYSDNVAIGRNMAETLTEYSRRYAYPKVVLCANDAFFSYIESKFAGKIPTVRGCGGSWWEDGAGSSAVETAINRVTHEEIVAAETVWGVASAAGIVAGDSPGAAESAAPHAPRVPQERFNRVWDNVLLYDEHTWGAHNSITAPQSDFVQRQWAVKAAFATDAAIETRQLLEEGLDQLASRVEAPAGSVLVFNPSGQARSGVVHVRLPRDRSLADEQGILPQQVVAAEALKEIEVAVWVKDVPPVGYRTCLVVPQAQKVKPDVLKLEKNTFENGHYRIEWDPAAGGIRSIIEKATGRELVDAGSPYKLGQLIYAAGGEEKKGETQVECPNPAKVTYTTSTGAGVSPGVAGPVFSSVKSNGKLIHFREIEMETILHEQEARIDFVFRLDKVMVYEKEAVYIAFPIAGQRPQFRYEIGGGSVRPNEDHFPGGCRDWFSVQRWVTVQTDEGVVAWSPMDTPLITLCDLTPGKWVEELPVTNGTIFAYIMNNYWFTNYKAGQDGRFTFRFSLTSGKQIDTAEACRFGEQVQSPLRAATVRPGRVGGAKLPPSASFCHIEPAGVQISTLKPADDGKGMILRLRETTGRPTDATITLSLPRRAKASRCDLVERVQEPLTLKDGTLSLKLGAIAMATVRVE